MDRCGSTEAMSSRKNQHYVPKMYLRLFAEPGGRQIGVLPLSTGELVTGASIRDQASRPWFYDRDGSIEEALGTIEGEASRIIAAMLGRDRPPRRGSSEHQGLVTFLSIQLSRTQAAADDVNERTEKVAKALLRQAHEGNTRLNNLDLVKIKLTSPVDEAMRWGFLGTPLLYDLHYKLIINTSGCPLTASDAPVVLHKRWYEGTGTPALGLADEGLQLIVPLGPWRAMIFYDPGLYAVGSTVSSTVRLVNPAHADQLNDLQFESARSVIFVPPGMPISTLRAGWERSRTKRPDRVIVDHVVVERSATSMRTRLGVGAVPSQVRLDLPFVRERAERPPAWDGRSPPPSRHPAWVSHVRALAKAVDQGLLAPDSFVELTLKVPRPSRRHRGRP